MRPLIFFRIFNVLTVCDTESVIIVILKVITPSQIRCADDRLRNELMCCLSMSLSIFYFIVTDLHFIGIMPQYNMGI